MKTGRIAILTSAVAAVVLYALGAVACEPRRSPSGGATEIPLRVDERGVLLLDGLGDLGPQIQAAMGTAADREARAPYSPEGWPINRGDVVSFSRYQELQAEYGAWLGVRAAFWVGKLVFGAQWTFSHDDNGSFHPDMEYIGHFPEKTKHEDWPEHLPAHLVSRIIICPDREPCRGSQAGFQEVGESVFKLRGSVNIEEMKLIWTRDQWLDGYTGEDTDQ